MQSPNSVPPTPAMQPMQQPEQQAPMAPEVDDDSMDIINGLEEHLNNISDDAKAYLVENLNPVNVTVLGIVCGQEVYEYFNNIYNEYVKPTQDGISGAVSPQNSGTAPTQQNMGKPMMEPMSQPSNPMAAIQQ